MIGPKLMEQAFDGLDKIKKTQIFAKMTEKEKNSSPEEQQRVADIKKNLSKFMKSKDHQGALDYLKHVKNESN